MSICIATVPPPMACSRPPPWCSGPTRRRRAAGADRPDTLEGLPEARRRPLDSVSNWSTVSSCPAPGAVPPFMCWATVSTSTPLPCARRPKPCTGAAGRAPRNRPAACGQGYARCAGGRAGDPAGPGRQRQRAGAAAFRRVPGPGRLGQGSRRRVPQVAGAGKLGDVKQHWPTLEEVVGCLREARAWISLAHPYHYDFTRTKRRRLVADFLRPADTPSRWSMACSRPNRSVPCRSWPASSA